MIKHSKILLGVICSVLLGLLALVTVKPAPVQAAGAGFAVEAQPNQAQYDQNVTYFDLKLAPKQQTTLKVKVINETAKPLRLRAEPNTGYTADAGNEVYDKQRPKQQLSKAPYQLTNLLGGPQKVTLAPHEKRVLAFPLTMPDKPFNGVLEGALYFDKLNQDEKPQATNRKQFQIRNRYAVVLGVVLRSSEGQMVSPNLKLNRVKVGTDKASRFSPAVKANLENTRANWMRGLKISSKVSRNQKTLYKTSGDQVDMAANSNFNYAISTNHERLKAGRYKLHLVAQLDQKRWVFNRHFTVSAKQAKQVNDQSRVKKSYLIWWILLAVIILLIAGGSYYWYRKKHRDKHQQS